MHTELTASQSLTCNEPARCRVDARTGPVSRQLLAAADAIRSDDSPRVYVLLAYWEKKERGLCSLGP